MSHKIPFNAPYATDQDLAYIKDALFNTGLSGDGPYTKKCHAWLENQTKAEKALITHSCTAALEMAALLLEIEPGDEIIMPSYTFVSTANAFVLRGGIPVFIDIRPDTLNIDETLIEQAITKKTKAIVPVHYAGVSCEMDTILELAKKYNLAVVEDAAQGVQAFYKARALGSIGDFGCYSFHGTKNVISGEGGALLVNDKKYSDMAEIIREKGTNRSQFFKGFVDKYTWQSIGSSYLPSELTAAFLLSQLEQAEEITKKRLSIWDYYHESLNPLEDKGIIQRPTIPKECQHNAHMYYIVLDKKVDHQNLLDIFQKNNISAPYHYIPLHSSPAGEKFGRVEGSMDVTNRVSRSIIRLPLWVGLKKQQQDFVVDILNKELG